MNKIMLILLDGLNADTARTSMSFLELLRIRGLASFKIIRTVLPSVSKAAYATIVSGLDPLDHGLLRNDDRSTFKFETIFSRAAGAGLSTAAAAHAWFAEICNGQDPDHPSSRFCYDPLSPINHGLFYASDSYPDRELFADAEVLRQLCDPDLMLAHTMGIDNAGHLAGRDSDTYRRAARNADALLSRYVPIWMDAGYQILIMSDHGMDASGDHYDNTPENALIPLWGIGEAWQILPERPHEIAGMICDRLGA